MKTYDIYTNLTLSKEFVLRRNESGNFLFHIPSSIRYEITRELYAILDFFKYNLLSITAFSDILKENNIIIDSDMLCEKLSLIDVPNILANEIVPYRENKPSDNFREKIFPERIDWLITEKCNLACKHCLQGSSCAKENKDFNIHRLKELFDEMEKMDIETLKITGGEPLLANNAKEIFRLLSNKLFDKTILSNLMLLDNEWIEIFKNKTFHLSTSIDGCSKKSHDYIRGNGSFDILIANLKKLKQNNVHFASTVTIHPLNVDELNEIPEFVFNDLGSRKIIFNFLRPIGRARKNNNLHLSKESLIKVKAVLREIKKEYGNKVFIDDEADLAENSDKYSYTQETKIKCAAGTTLMSLDENLNIFPCNYGIGNQFFLVDSAEKRSLSDIWLSDKWGVFRDGVPLHQIKGCKSCDFLSKCTLKQCRLKPFADGVGFYSHVDYCYRANLNSN